MTALQLDAKFAYCLKGCDGMKQKSAHVLKVHIVNPDAELDPQVIKRFAAWLVEFGLKTGTITLPAERGADYLQPSSTH